MNSNARFVIKPNFNNLSEYRLKYTDILTYITIRSFYNSKDKYCYPSYEAIATNGKISKKFVSESLKRLSKAGYINIWKIGKVRFRHCYRFKEISEYQKLPYSYLENQDLTLNEKGMLLLLSEYAIASVVSQPLSEIALCTGLTYKTIGSQYKSLIEKGYLKESLIKEETNNTLTKIFSFTDLVKWDFKRYFDDSIESDKASSNTESILDMAMNYLRVMKGR